MNEMGVDEELRLAVVECANRMRFPDFSEESFAHDVRADVSFEGSEASTGQNARKGGFIRGLTDCQKQPKTLFDRLGGSIAFPAQGFAVFVPSSLRKGSSLASITFPPLIPLTSIFLLAATLTFAAAVVQALLALRSGRWKQDNTQILLMAIGFVLQTAFLYHRGQEVGQCPMKSLPDILVFIGWSVVLLYFLVGSGFRLSLLGVFTAPLVTVVQGLALLQGFNPYAVKGKINALVELHAAMALIAYAAFALGCITGIMYLVQERLLKQHRIGGLFYQLPPIQGLAKAIQRLVSLGLVLLSVALAISFALHTPVSNPKLVFSWIVWGLYAVIAFFMWRHVTSPRRTAWLAVVGFVLPFISLWIVTHA